MIFIKLLLILAVAYPFIVAIVYLPHQLWEWNELPEWYSKLAKSMYTLLAIEFILFIAVAVSGVMFITVRTIWKM